VCWGTCACPCWDVFGLCVGLCIGLCVGVSVLGCVLGCVLDCVLCCWAVLYTVYTYIRTARTACCMLCWHFGMAACCATVGMVPAGMCAVLPGVY
jgi:hypothetical protein